MATEYRWGFLKRKRRRSECGCDGSSGDAVCHHGVAIYRRGRALARGEETAVGRHARRRETHGIMEVRDRGVTVGSGGAAGFAWGDCSKPDGARTAPHGGGFLLGSPWDRWLGGRFFFKVSHFIKKTSS
jgi:hypothetical protein